LNIKYLLSAGRRQKKKSRRSADNRHAIIIYCGGFEQIKAAVLFAPQTDDALTLAGSTAHRGSRHEA
jgi:hypothetical protein